VTKDADLRELRRKILSVVDCACFAERGLPPGIIGDMFAALDTMRWLRVERRELEQAEIIAVTIHRLRALLVAGAASEDNRSSARRQLRSSAQIWLGGLRLQDMGAVKAAA
jgi:hypothetical protein